MARKKNEPATREDWERLHARLEELSDALERIALINEKLTAENEQMRKQLTDWSSYN